MTLLERYKQNFEEGLEQGKLVGLEQGKLVGLKEGKLEVAKSMKEKGISDEIISEVTGLPQAAIDIL